MNTTEKFLKSLSDAYYSGSPKVTDEVYDNLVLTYNNPEMAVGSSNEVEKPHMRRMYSLNKSKPNLVFKTLVVTPKLDGAAIALTYLDGVLVGGLTRGDGIKGRDITDKVWAMESIPRYIPNSIGLTQITGEVVALDTIPNSRNYASGALSLKSLEEFANRSVTFIAYGVYPTNCALWTEEMVKCRKSGFYTVLDSDWKQYPQDGIVCRENDIRHFEYLGYTSHHPKGAYAVKEAKEGVVTTLVDVKWAVGRSGAVTPVGILEPVDINGAMVSKASLHNINVIRELDLEIGCKVEVIRSGEIIPYIVRRVYD